MKRRIAIFLIAGLAACSMHDYGPANYSPAKLGELQAGKTTLHEAKLLFGEPTSEMALPNGGTLLQWQQRKQQGVPGAPDSHLAIVFDADGRMLRIERATRR